jgi:hypothetical protein
MTVWASVCAIFAEQVKGGLIVPALRRLFRALELNRPEDKDRDDSKKKPLIVIP